MTVGSTSRMTLPLMALVVAGGIALVLGIQHVRRQQAAGLNASTATQAVPEPSPGARDQGPAALAAAEKDLNAAAAALAGPSPSVGSKDGVPTFDIARIEPTGEAVIAGRAAPGATVELLLNGELHDRAVADQSGEFAIVPRPLPPGNYGLTLRSTQPDGKQVTSKQSVAVTIAPSPNGRPGIAMMTPDKPVAVPPQPGTPKPTSGVVGVEAIKVEPSGKFHMTGHADPGTTVKLYLNDSFVTSVTAGGDKRFEITINEGVAPGSYRVRLDQMALNSAAVQGRVEMPFEVSRPAVIGSTASTPPEGHSDAAASKPPQVAAAAPTVSPDRSPSSAVVVPKIVTTTVARGDSLWRISRLSYGAGTRYAAIYRANRERIRNPNLIYPGQTFVVPTR